MRKITVIIALVVLLSSFLFTIRAAENVLEGDWMARMKGNKIRIEINYKDGNLAFELPLTQLKGLNSSQILSDYSDILYDLSRDAGTFHFKGFFKQGKGIGDVNFEPNPKFVSEMQSLGYRNLTDERILELAIHDVKLDYVRGLKSLGYKNVSLDELVEMNIHDVTLSYIQSLRDLGYQNVPIDKLVEMNIHDVTIDYIRGLNQLGIQAFPLISLSK